MSRHAGAWISAVSSRTRLSPHARTTTEEVHALDAWIESAIAAGVDVLQIRERDLEAGALRDVVRRAVHLAAGSQTVVLVNDRADVAFAAGAHGVHLPGNGLPAPAARRVRADWIVGRSVHDEDDPRDHAGLDYVLYGTVFPSRSKPGQTVAGLAGLARAAERWPCPVVAIGGISPARVRSCVEQGAHGVAAIGLFLPAGTEPESLGPAEAVRQLRAALAG